MNWISVKDKMPNDYEDVLVCADDGYVCVADHSYVDGAWRDTFDSYWPDESGIITHWMPLPKPPEAIQ